MLPFVLYILVMLVLMIIISNFSHNLDWLPLLGWVYKGITICAPITCIIVPLWLNAKAGCYELAFYDELAEVVEKSAAPPAP